MNNIEKHTFPPVFDCDSKILILGSFPSVASRQNNFYYGHPRNRFWQVISILTGSLVPNEIGQKIDLLLKHKLALWDVVESCSINGSSDSSIKNVVPADLSVVLEKAEIKTIFANGGTAYKLYQKYCYENTGREIIKLPSTSPANAAYSLDKLIDSWRQILYLESK